MRDEEEELDTHQKSERLSLKMKIKVTGSEEFVDIFVIFPTHIVVHSHTTKRRRRTLINVCAAPLQGHCQSISIHIILHYVFIIIMIIMTHNGTYSFDNKFFR